MDKQAFKTFIIGVITGFPIAWAILTYYNPLDFKEPKLIGEINKLKSELFQFEHKKANMQEKIKRQEIQIDKFSNAKNSKNEYPQPCLKEPCR